MSKEIKPLAQKLLDWQANLVIVNSVIACIVGIYISAEYVESTAMSVLLGLFTSFILMKVLNIATFTILALWFYGWDSEKLRADIQDTIEYLEEDPEEDQEELFSTISLKIVNTPDKHMGTFMDSSFYEWLDIEDVNKETKRFWFSGTINMEKGMDKPLPDGTFLIPPGILYQVDPV